MPETPGLRFSDQELGLFSPQQIASLMQVEFERAQRHRYPLVCMLVAIDRLGQLQDLYGYDSQAEILAAVTAALRESLRDSDLLGRLADDRLLVVFPHTTPEAAAALARRTLLAARALRFERDGRRLRASLSIGLSSNQHEEIVSFETLLRVAEEGLAVADAAGGDRFVETELYALYERSHAGRRARGRGGAGAGPAAAAASAPAPALAREAAQAERLGRALTEYLAAQGLDPAALTGLDPATLAAVLAGLRAAPAGGGSEAERQRQVEQLERRLAKVSQLLTATEEELRRVAALRGVETGLSSVFRSVQGLAPNESQLERKRAMMRTIFEANRELRRLTRPATDGGAGPESPPKESA